MPNIYCVITNNGDGSNSLLWADNDHILDRMKYMAQRGYETFASGDGLQVTTFRFNDFTALSEFVNLNQIKFETEEDLEDYRY